MTTLILTKDELRILQQIAKQRSVTLGEAVKLLIRAAEQERKALAEVLKAELAA